MQLIPVLDLLDGHAVRAVRGERDRYRPVRSALADTSDPLVIARALVAASGARMLYVADLGAILQRGAHTATLAAMSAALPGVEIWLDAGFADHAAMRACFDDIAEALQSSPRSSPLMRAARDASVAKQPVSPLSIPPSVTDARFPSSMPLVPFVPVFGTESLRERDALDKAVEDGLAPILSLDHRAGQLIADPALGHASSWWPQRVITMTLDQVGSYDGPDLATLASVRERARAGTQLIGAGGIRDRADLAHAETTGAHAWLVASALHDRRLDR